MIQDLHSHTYYSYCGKDSPEAVIKNADKIIVLTENGTAESGSHAELIAADGIYSKMYGFYQ